MKCRLTYVQCRYNLVSQNYSCKLVHVVCPLRQNLPGAKTMYKKLLGQNPLNKCLLWQTRQAKVLNADTYYSYEQCYVL